MIDPADQRASDEAIKRTTNLTPTEVRVSLNATAIDFQRRVDAAQSITPTISVPKPPGQITSTETKLEGQPISLPTTTDAQNQNPFPSPQTPPVPTGTASNPYEMGENRTTTDPTAANDTWTRAGGPVPSGGGPYDGVVTTNPRYVSNGDGTGILYTRREEFDSNGAIFAIGAELPTTIP